MKLGSHKYCAREIQNKTTEIHMRKTLPLLALLGTFAGSAYAQSTVEIYGVLDEGLIRESGGATGSVTKLTSGIASQSRIGFRGTEDLGGGLKAKFVLEGGIGIDTGTSLQGGTLFGRTSYVGLEGQYGSIIAGRFFTPQFVTIGYYIDPFATGYSGAASNVMANTGLRMSNTVLYTTPKFSGISGELAYGAGEIAGDTSAGRQLGGAVSYNNGPLNLRIAHHNKNNNTDVVKNADSAKNTIFGGNYDFTFAKAYFGYAINKGLNSSSLAVANAYGYAVAPVASTNSRDMLVGVSVPFGVGTLLASIVHKDDKTAFNQDATQYGLGFTYPLSKRTDLYTSIAYIKNQNGAGYTVGNMTELGSGNKAYNVGMRHSF
jgi:predicted porin